jgi:hypothetical protein
MQALYSKVPASASALSSGFKINDLGDPSRAADVPDRSSFRRAFRFLERRLARLIHAFACYTATVETR